MREWILMDENSLYEKDIDIMVTVGICILISNSLSIIPIKIIKHFQNKRCKKKGVNNIKDFGNSYIIKIGDEVINSEGRTGIVTNIMDNDNMHDAIIMFNNGMTYADNVFSLKKTGKNYPEIKRLLSSLKKE